MILMIDNYDSFTFNVVQYLLELGADVTVRRNDEISIEDIERLAPEKIVVSPGPARRTKPASRWRPSLTSRVKFPCWVSAWDIKVSAKASVAGSCGPTKSCMVKRP